MADAKPEVTTDELLVLLGCKEAELYALRRDHAKALAARDATYRDNLKVAEDEIGRLRAEGADLKAAADGAAFRAGGG